MTLLLPTRYVNVAAAVVYAADLPDPLFRTYSRLVGLAWRDKAHDYTQLPTLSLAELADCCHLKPRALRLHLHALQQAGLIICTGTAAAYTIQIQSPGVQSFAQVQSFALPMMMDHDDVVDPDQREDQQHHDGRVQNFALSENLRALQAFGINPTIPDAQRVAALPHVTPEFIRAWGEALSTVRDTHNLPGRLLYKLQTTQQMPRTETRGGDHRPISSVPSAATTPAGSASLLPSQVMEDLARLGFSGPVDEVATVYAQDAEFVIAWLAHCLAHAATLRNPVGFFRHKLRGDAYPPEPLALPPAPVPPPPPSPAAQLWQRTLTELALQLPQATFEMHLRGSQAQDFASDGRLPVLVKDPNAIPWLEGRLASLIAQTIHRVAGRLVTVQFIAPPAGNM